jgi:hypothetical protein
MSHTPGPWILDYDRGSTRDILSKAHGSICMVRRAGRHDSATFLANAKLIAAAPELLEAAKMLNIVLCANDLTNSQVSCLLDLRNAINKATK